MDHSEQDVHGFSRSPAGVALWVVLAVGGFYLLTEHTAHLFGALPYLFLLACPLMHVFMHRGHGHHGDRHDRPRSGNDERGRQ